VRICSLLPSATEIIYALGLGDSMVGVTHECDYPPEAKEVPVVVHSRIDHLRAASSAIDQSVRDHVKAHQSIYSVDLPRLRNAKPDLILTQQLCDVCAIGYDDVVAAAASLPGRPRVLSLTPNTLTDVLDDIARIGNIAGKAKEADSLIGRLRREIESIHTRTAASRIRPRVACLEWLDPIYSAGHWLPEMVSLAGGTDELATAGSPSRRIPWTRVREFEPEVMVLMPCGFDVQRTMEELDLVRRLPGWHELPAVREGRLFAVNGHAYFNRPGPRLVQGLQILAQIIHPEIFPWTSDPGRARMLNS